MQGAVGFAPLRPVQARAGQDQRMDQGIYLRKRPPRYDRQGAAGQLFQPPQDIEGFRRDVRLLRRRRDGRQGSVKVEQQCVLADVVARDRYGSALHVDFTLARCRGT